MKYSFRSSAAALALVAFVFGSGLSAQTVNWGNTLNPEGAPGFQEMSFASDGTAIDSTGTTFSFEIGTFSKLVPNFTPDDANVDIWKDNWNPLHSVSYTPTLNWFSGSYSLDAGDTSHVGLRAYIWVYDSDMALSTSDWFLVTGDTEGGGLAGAPTDENWRVPTIGGAGGTFDWRVTTANTAVWGSLNSGAIEGGGYRSADPGTFEMQAFAVPEPSSLATLLLGALGLGLRRRR